LSISLSESLRNYVLTNLPHDRTNANVAIALREMTPAKLLVTYINWHNRLISASPRKVLQSSTFAKNPLVQTRSTTIRKIVKDIERGNDLTKYLSRGVRVGFSLPRDPEKKELHRRRDLDLLLNDWGIHHLHISTTVEADGFVERDGPLIFGAFKEQTAYLIDVMNHREWTNQHLVQIIIGSWPNAGLAFELKGIIPSEQTYTAEERMQLRGVGISTSVNIAGRAFMPSSGISTAGTSTRASMTAMHILRILKKFEDEIKANPAGVLNFIHQNGGKVHGDPAFEFSLFKQGFGVIETTSGFPILLG
jgi:hypothetical protein